MQENNILFLQKIENVAWKACRGEGVNFCNESIFFSGSCSLKDQMCVSGDAWKWNKMYNHPTRSHTCQEETWRNITSRIKVGTASSCLPGADIQVAGQKDKSGEIYKITQHGGINLKYVWRQDMQGVPGKNTVLKFQVFFTILTILDHFFSKIMDRLDHFGMLWIVRTILYPFER